MPRVNVKKFPWDAISTRLKWNGQGWSGERPADAPKVAATDLNAGFLMVKQGKTAKKLPLRLDDDGVLSALSAFITDLLERGALNGIKTSRLITNTSGLRMSQQILRNRWDEAREKAAIKAGANGDSALAALASTGFQDRYTKFG
jgi:hypothetical protein